MAPFVSILRRLLFLCGLAFVALFATTSAIAQDSKNLAPGFLTIPKSVKIVLMPADIELFSISAGGILEPKADWTDVASKHFKAALAEKKRNLGLLTVELSDVDADNFSEVNNLHAAVARAIAIHHFGPGFFTLPTKEEKLDWSMGDSVKGIREKTGADYAFFSWVRDSYASAERVAAMIGLALLGVGVGGGIQVGYASLVDLKSGQIVWFNRLGRGSGDLREAGPAAETIEALLENFPGIR